MAVLSRPLASVGVLGITTFIPGAWENQASRDWVCWAALARPAPDMVR
jgi:hypothetical protein